MIVPKFRFWDTQPIQTMQILECCLLVGTKYCDYKYVELKHKHLAKLVVSDKMIYNMRVKETPKELIYHS